MGDIVQKILESTIPELEELQKRKLASQSEIQSIVRTRNGHEFSFLRRPPLLSDFLSAVQYERQLSALKSTRKKMKGIVKKLKCEHFSNQRIHFIYERAFRNFSGNIQLIHEFLSFASNTGGTKQIANLLPKFLQLHLHEISLWKAAISFEFHMNSSIEHARILAMRGLRFNGNTQNGKDLWIFFFRTEIQFIGKVLERKRRLGISARNKLTDAQKENEKDESDEMKLVAQNTNNDDTEKSMTACLNVVLPTFIFNNAIAANNRVILDKKSSKKRRTEHADAEEESEAEVERSENDEIVDEKFKEEPAGSDEMPKKRKKRKSIWEDDESEAEAKLLQMKLAAASHENPLHDDVDFRLSFLEHVPLEANPFYVHDSADVYYQYFIPNKVQVKDEQRRGITPRAMPNFATLIDRIVDSALQDFGSVQSKVWKASAQWEMHRAAHAQRELDDKMNPIDSYGYAVFQKALQSHGHSSYSSSFAVLLESCIEWLTDRISAHEHDLKNSQTENAMEVKSDKEIEHETAIDWLMARVTELSSTAHKALTSLPDFVSSAASSSVSSSSSLSPSSGVTSKALLGLYRLFLLHHRFSDAEKTADLAVKLWPHEADVWIARIGVHAQQFFLRTPEATQQHSLRPKKGKGGKARKEKDGTQNPGQHWLRVVELYNAALQTVDTSSARQALINFVLQIYKRRLADETSSSSSSSSTQMPIPSIVSECISFFQAAIGITARTAAEHEVCVLLKRELMQLADSSLAEKANVTLVDSLLASAPVSEELFLAAIQLEKAHLKPIPARIYSLYEHALQKFGQTSVELYLSYLQFAESEKNVSLCQKIHWRALNTLQSSLHSQLLQARTLQQMGVQPVPSQ